MSALPLLIRALKARFRDQTLELRALHQALTQNQPQHPNCPGMALDIGANKGSYLYWLARWAAPRGHLPSAAPSVIAFEPQAVLAQYLTQAFAGPGQRHVRVEGLALSDRCGQAALFVPGDHHSPGASLEAALAHETPCHQESVHTLTLDAYLNTLATHAPLCGPVRAMKIDVEGHEAAVLEGARQTIDRYHPWIVMECEQRHLPQGHCVQQVVERVCAMGYTATFVCIHPQHRPIEKPMAQFDPALHQKQTGERFWDAKDYCNNFIFRPQTLSQV
jgi:FkbM family methyltransferase